MFYKKKILVLLSFGFVFDSYKVIIIKMKYERKKNEETRIKKKYMYKFCVSYKRDEFFINIMMRDDTETTYMNEYETMPFIHITLSTYTVSIITK